MLRPDAKPGDKMIHDGADYFAVDDSNYSCSACAFDVEALSHVCVRTSCHEVVWLTQANFIIHRLTS